MFVKRKDLEVILDCNDRLLRSNTDFCEKLLEADKKNAFISEMIFEMMKRPEYKAPEFQQIFIELVTRMIEGLTKEEYEERCRKIRDFFEGESKYSSLSFSSPTLPLSVIFCYRSQRIPSP